MADIVSPEKRSQNMSAIRSKNTKPEVYLRKLLFAQGYKLLDNTVKVKAGLQQTDLTGAKLMQTAFSPNKPLLRLNECVSTSEQNEQSGYMQILAGCMVGIRNPRAHDSDWEDTEERSLQLLSFANHLMERILVSEKVDY